ncbi:MAG: cytochrome-c peroxidase [Pedosphaera sp.]|nr:cytochrome-c peroxidase [Pedosphaera sp.]
MRLEALPGRAPEPTGNPITPAKSALGRLLFFDPILSGSKDVACATCHHPRFAWGDGRATSIGVGGSGIGPQRKFLASNPLPLIPRNAPTLLNVGFNGFVAGGRPGAAAEPMFWDARVTGLEKQVLVPIRSREEMRGDACTEADAVEQALGRIRAIAEYRELFGVAFESSPDQSVTAARLAQAIAAFERSLITPDTPFDRFMRAESSALNAEQQRGLRVFQDSGCIQCHGGPMLSDYKLHFIGAPDSTRGGLRDFRTPTLRNLRHSAPYMHNGSQRTLRDVLVFYEALSDGVSETLDGGNSAGEPRLDPLLKRLNLNADDFPAIEAFLDALNDDRYDQSEPAQVPSRLPVAGAKSSP